MAGLYDSKVVWWGSDVGKVMIDDGRKAEERSLSVMERFWDDFILFFIVRYLPNLRYLQDNWYGGLGEWRSWMLDQPV